MSATEPQAAGTAVSRVRQAGSVAVEFALLSLVFFAFLFAMIELARLLYMWNTLPEVTRRAAHAAATADFSNPSALDQIRQDAVFRTTAGGLLLGAPVTDAFVRIDYLSLSRASGGGAPVYTRTPIPAAALPGCPVRNRLNCMGNPNGASCIRFVRVRLCAPSADASACNPVPYAPIVPLVALTLNLPTATTIVKAESLGYQPGAAICP